ncbi:MAG: hypothetical protein ABSE41_16715, partial [Bacteroidota bacterium]
MKRLVANQKRSSELKGISRRQFVKIVGISALGASSLGHFKFETNRVSIVVDPADVLAGSTPSQWAVRELEESLKSRGINVYRCDLLAQARNSDLIIVAAGSDSFLSRKLLQDTGVIIPAVPEALGVVPSRSDDKRVLLACGHDVRGLVYALLEL